MIKIDRFGCFGIFSSALGSGARDYRSDQAWETEEILRINDSTLYFFEIT